MRLDERSAGFVALGAALASGRPVVIVVTSGTAAAELHPAVVEADLSAVPLVVCTADRPPELLGVGAPQTITQHGLYGTPSASPPIRDGRRRHPPDVAVAGRPGPVGGDGRPGGPRPVHLNLAFRDPLVVAGPVAAVPGPARTGPPAARRAVARRPGPAATGRAGRRPPAPGTRG